MVWPKGSFVDGEGAPTESLGARQVALHLQEDRQVIERRRGLGMVGSESVFIDGEGPAKERFGVSVVTGSRQAEGPGIEHLLIVRKEGRRFGVVHRGLSVPPLSI